MQLQADISRNKLKAKIGTKQMVLIDQITDEHIIARSMSDAPEIDGLVYLPLAKEVSIGDLLQVRIQDSDDYDLFGDYTQD